MPDDLLGAALAAIETSPAASDPDRPLFHLAPPVGRLNDPNGLCVVAGTYHAFYQFSPFHPVYQFDPAEPRKLVYWGHASSTDLTHWTPHPPALVPQEWYETHGVYSGNAVVVDGRALLHYTGNVRHPDGGRDTHQCLATTDDLVTFTKDPGNPVIDHPPPGYTRHVRDPQVWQHADGTFRMCLGGQRNDLTGCALLYRSADLRAWEFEGELTFPGHEALFGSLGYMWECPALVCVPDEDGGSHDVLVFCPQGYDPGTEGWANVFPACAVIGRLDGTAFHAASGIVEIDRGFEFYAPQTFARAADDPGPTLMAAWLGNAGEDDQPSMEHGWVHTFTVVRELRVRDGRLVQIPRVDLGAADPVDPGLPARLGEAWLDLAGLAGARSFNLRFSVETHDDPDAGWELRWGTGASHVALSVRGGVLTVDRSTTRYPHGDRRSVTLPPANPLAVELFCDRSTTEVFLGDGALTFSLRSFLPPGVDEPLGVRMRATGDVTVAGARAHRFD